MANISSVRMRRWNLSAFDEIRRERLVVADLARRGEKVRAGCGDGYRLWVEQGKTRARATVAAWSFEARHDNQDHHTLLANLDRGRL